jgi:hypothetical protein
MYRHLVALIIAIFTTGAAHAELKVRLRVNSESVNLKDTLEKEFRDVLGEVWDLTIVNDGGPVDTVILVNGVAATSDFVDRWVSLSTGPAGSAWIVLPVQWLDRCLWSGQATSGQTADAGFDLGTDLSGGSGCAEFYACHKSMTDSKLRARSAQPNFDSPVFLTALFCGI